MDLWLVVLLLLLLLQIKGRLRHSADCTWT
jgi:hypothetical protein